MGTLRDFNPGGLPRRTYLSGRDERFRSKFWMQTPMFIRRGPTEKRVPAPEHLHPWVAEADRESKAFKANPDRPRVWVKDGSSTKRIQDCVPDSLQRGDVVAVSFTVTYHLTATNWFPQFHPAEIVVLQATTGDATDYSAPALGLHALPPPSFYVANEADGKRGC